MATIKIIDPVTRLEGHQKITVKIDTVGGVQKVVDSWSTGTLFRGFEKILIDRAPNDAQHITQRICGVCPVSHGMAAVIALDKAANLVVPDNARIMRNLVLGSNFIASHILHFYHLTAPDFIDGPDMPPWKPAWSVDRRLDPATTKALVSNYVKALDMRRKAHEMGALFGGRLPHPPAYLPGGFTTQPNATRISRFKSYLAELTPFIQNTYIPDVKKIGQYYPDYYSIGRGYGNLLAYGVFDLDSLGNTKLFKAGHILNASFSVQPLDINAITEQVTYSWYTDTTNNLKPAVGVTTTVDPAVKTKAYSWLKAPRYSNVPHEAGPLARMWVNGDYHNGISVIDRHLARAQEALKVAQAMNQWVNQLVVGQPVYKTWAIPASASAVGLTEAPRGALGHWLQITGSKISRYQVITPTCWNASPRGTNNARGPIEQALIGTPVKDINRPVEVLRVIHSFDPCLSCAVHVMRPQGDKKIFVTGSPAGGALL